jgi:hypothetical protein
MEQTSTESNRTSELRRMPVLDSSPMLTPFVYMHAQFGYSVESIYRKINSQPTFHLGTYPNTFPNTIQEYFWIYTTPTLWKALGTFALNGTLVYFFYTASTNSNGSFIDEQRGVMNLWVSTRYADLIHFVMDTETYNQYVLDTVRELENE